MTHFNPRSLTGSDCFSVEKHGYFKQFQSTLPYRERRTTPKSQTAVEEFQSTLPYRERLIFCKFFALISGFQSTLPYRERQKFQHHHVNFQLFQSTLPYRERPVAYWQGVDNAIISIHAPLQGATARRIFKDSPVKQFQSTLPYRERQQKCTKRI